MKHYAQVTDEDFQSVLDPRQKSHPKSHPSQSGNEQNGQERRNRPDIKAPAFPSVPNSSATKHLTTGPYWTRTRKPNIRINRDL